MATDENTLPASQAVVGQQFTLAFNTDERQVLQMALGELLNTVRRDERLVPTIESLLQRLKDTDPGA